MAIIRQSTFKDSIPRIYSNDNTVVGDVIFCFEVLNFGAGASRGPKAVILLTDEGLIAGLGKWDDDPASSYIWLEFGGVVRVTSHQTVRASPSSPANLEGEKWLNINTSGKYLNGIVHLVEAF